MELEETRVQRKLPDTLLIEIKECGDPLAWAQDGTVWLVSPGGKIVEQLPPDKCRVNFPGFGLKVILSAFLTLEE